MLHFLVTVDHSYTLQEYFSEWGASLRAKVRIVHYEVQPWQDEPLPGAWIFTDLERLRGEEAAAARKLAERLAADPARWRVLNDPRRVLLRLALMRELAGAGINDFRAFRLHEIPADIRYPLFLRGENDHEGAITELLQDADQLKEARRALPAEAEMLAVEYADCRREDGLYVKYSMMRIGGEVVPRHTLFSRRWVLKDPDLVDEALMQQEDRFVEEQPHRRQIEEVFQRAGIDYSLSRGRIQVFEINTNPIVLAAVARLAPRRWRSQATSALQINGALVQLDAGLPEVAPGLALSQLQTDRRRLRIHRLMQRARSRPRFRR